MRENRELKALDIQKMFGITPPTLYNWRKEKGFPFHKMHCVGKRNTPVIFYELEVREWARINHVTIVDELENGKS